MTKAQNIRDGLNIILTREPETEIDATHDTIFCGSEDGPYTDEDRKALKRLGWFTSEESWAIHT